MKLFFIRVSIVLFFLSTLFGMSASVTAIGCALETQKPYKISTSNSIWYISENCTKRPIRTPAVFFSHFTSWKEVRTVSASILNAIPSDPLSFLPWGPRRVFENGSLVKTVTDPSVYLLLNGIRYKIANEDTMVYLGYEWNWIEDVFPEVLHKYVLKENPVEGIADIPVGAQVVVSGSPTVYTITGRSGESLAGTPQKTMEDVRRVYRADRLVRLAYGNTVIFRSPEEPEITHLANVSLPTRDCSGSVFQLSGMKEYQKALVLTNGHCSGLGTYLGTYPDNGEIFVNESVSGQAILRKEKKGVGDTVGYNKILFASMSGTDLAVIELETTYKQIRDLGYYVYFVAKDVPQKGSLLEFDSYNRNVRSLCQIEDVVGQLQEGPWIWKNVLRMVDEPGCRFVHGQSGTPGVIPGRNSIYAVAHTAYEGGPECSLNNPCEVNENTKKVSVGKVDQGYAVPVARLYECYDETEGVFDFRPVACPLSKL